MSKPENELLFRFTSAEIVKCYERLIAKHKCMIEDAREDLAEYDTASDRELAEIHGLPEPDAYTDTPATGPRPPSPETVRKLSIRGRRRQLQNMQYALESNEIMMRAVPPDRVFELTPAQCGIFLFGVVIKVETPQGFAVVGLKAQE